MMAAPRLRTLCVTAVPPPAPGLARASGEAAVIRLREISAAVHMTSGRSSFARTWSPGPQTETAATTSSKLRIGAATHATPGTASSRSVAYPALRIPAIAA